MQFTCRLFLFLFSHSYKLYKLVVKFYIFTIDFCFQNIYRHILLQFVLSFRFKLPFGCPQLMYMFITSKLCLKKVVLLQRLDMDTSLWKM